MKAASEQIDESLYVVRMGYWRLFRSTSVSYWVHDSDPHRPVSDRIVSHNKMAIDLRWLRKKASR